MELPRPFKKKKSVFILSFSQRHIIYICVFIISFIQRSVWKCSWKCRVIETSATTLHLCAILWILCLCEISAVYTSRPPSVPLPQITLNTREMGKLICNQTYTSNAIIQVTQLYSKHTWSELSVKKSFFSIKRLPLGTRIKGGLQNNCDRLLIAVFKLFQKTTDIKRRGSKIIVS